MSATGEPKSQEDSRLPTTDLTQIHQIVIKEARICLQQAKDMIVDYIDADWDRQHLQPLPALLTQVRGALAMIPLSRAASLIETCNHFIREHLLLDPDHPGWQELDSLADVITSIEYYLERLGDDPEAPGEKLLDVAEKSLAALGFFPSEQQVPVLEDVLSPSEAQVMQDLQELDDPETVKSLADVLASPVSSVNPPALTTPGSLLPPPSGEEPVDDELREVFLEETDEVLEILREYLPRWTANPDDKPALSELRRAFHTLKGSGRMVRALVLGELAWAVENLLNRVLERSVAPGPAVQQLLGDALNLLLAYDSEYPEPLFAKRPVPDCAGVALRLEPAPSAQALARVTVQTTEAPAPPWGHPALEPLRAAIRAPPRNPGRARPAPGFRIQHSSTYNDRYRRCG